MDDNAPEQVTDEVGRFVWDQVTDDTSEPLPGSVVLIGGPWGTAFQRWFLDGLWHSTREKGNPKPWSWLLARRNVVLAYDAEERPDDYEPNDDPLRNLMTGADLDAL